MNTEWFKSCKNAKEKEDKKVLLRSSHRILKELEDILSLKEETPKKTDYDSPSWPYRRADMDGYNRALTMVRDLINIDKGK